MKRLALPLRPDHGAQDATTIDQIRQPSRHVEGPAWDPSFASSLALAVRLAERCVVDDGYPTLSVNPWLVLALARRVATLEASNQALRQMKGVET